MSDSTMEEPTQHTRKMSQGTRCSPRRWTPQEDRLLRTQVDHFSRKKAPVDWSAVSSAFVARSNKDCRKRWQKIDTRWNSGAWTEKEDEKLRSGVSNYGICWAAISALVETRSPDQCAKRWRNVLDPSLDHGEWSQQNEALLYDLVHQHGRDWKLISETAFPNRSRQELSNRYALLLRKENNKRSNSTEPAQKLESHSPHAEIRSSCDNPSEMQYTCMMDGLDNNSLITPPSENGNCFDLLDGGYESPWVPCPNIDNGHVWDVDMFNNSTESFGLDYQSINASITPDSVPLCMPPMMMGSRKTSMVSIPGTSNAELAYLTPTHTPPLPENMPVVPLPEFEPTEFEAMTPPMQADTDLQQPELGRRPSRTVITISNLSSSMRTAIVDMILREGGHLSIATE